MYTVHCTGPFLGHYTVECSRSDAVNDFLIKTDDEMVTYLSHIIPSLILFFLIFQKIPF